MGVASIKAALLPSLLFRPPFPLRVCNPLAGLCAHRTFASLGSRFGCSSCTHGIGHGKQCKQTTGLLQFIDLDIDCVK